MNPDMPSPTSDSRGSPPESTAETKDSLDYASSGVDDLRPLVTDTSVQNGSYISPAYAEYKEDLSHKKRLRVIALVIIAILLLGGTIFALVHKKSGQNALQTGAFSKTSIALSTIPQITGTQQTASLRVNGQLQANNSIVLAPTVQPSSPVIGQLYFDKTSKLLRYYDGTKFNNLGEQITNITNNTVITQGSTGPAVLLQTSSPGSAQSGNFNVSGVGTANILQGTSSVITPSLDSSGGTLSVGTVNAGAISIGKNGITVSVNGALSVAQTTTLSGDLTVTGLGDVAFQHGADYTNTAVTDDINFGKGSLFRLNGASGQVITGIAGGTDGRLIRIINASASSAMIANNSTNSLAANRITTGTGGDITVPSGASVSLVYDSVDNVWRNVGVATTPGGGGSGSYVTLQASTPGSADAGNFNISGTGKLGTLSVSGNAGITGTLTATNLSGNGSAVTNVDAATLQGHNTAYFNNASNLSTGTVATGLVTGSYTGITAVGTLTGLSVSGTGAFTGTVSGADATANNQFVTLSQLNSAIGGVGGGVSSLNTLIGGLTLQGTTGHITVSSNGTNTLTLDLGTNVTVQGNTFNGASQLVQLDGTGKFTALNGSALTNLNASNLSTGTVASGLVSGSYTGITAVGTLTSLNVTGTGAFGGTVSGANATLSNQFVTLSQLNSAIGGVGGVTSLNTLSGALTVQGTTGQVTVTPSGGNTLTLAVGANVTVQGNTFNGVSQLVQTDASGFLPALNGSALTALNASNLASGTVASGRVAGAYTGITSVGTLTSLDVSGTTTTNALSVTTTAGITGSLTVGGTGAFTGTVSGANATVSNQFVTLSQLTGAVGGVAPTLQNTYDNSSTPATIVLSSTNKGITLKDASTTVGGNLFAVQNNAGSATYLGVTTSGVNVAGTFAVSGAGSFTGRVSGADAVSNNEFVTLSQLTGAVGGVGGGVTTVGTIDGGTYSADGASISGTTIFLQSATVTHTGLVTTGTQTFGGNKTFSGSVAAASFSGDGSAITNLNASNLATGTVASGLVSGSYTGITAVGTLTSLGVTGNLTVGGTGAFTGTVSGANATLSNQFVTLSQLTGAVGGAVTSLNSLVGGLTIQGTTGDVTVSSNGTDTLTLAVGANVTIQGNTFNGVNQLVKLDGSGFLPALNGSALTNLNASNLATGTVASGLVSGSYTGITAVGTLTSLTASGNVAFLKGTDFSTTGSSNDVNFGTGALFRLTGASAQTITGIAGGADGRVITLVNAGTTAAVIMNNSLSSLAANRITTGTGANINLASGGAISLVYDAGASLWRVVGSTAAAGSGINYVTLQGSTPGTADTGNFNISGIGIAATLQGSTSVLSPLFDASTASTLNVGTATATAVSIGKSGATTTINGTLTVSQDATFNGNITVAASKSLTLTGGNTASRPASPSEGMLYYDTDTKKLIVYSNGKWQANSQAAIIVAASNSSQADKDAADYVATGTSDQTVINSALTAADPAGSGRKTGKVILLAGTYTTSDVISVPNNTNLAGEGTGSLIQFANLSGASKNMITNTTTSTGSGVVIRDLALDGNNSVNTTGTDYGIYLNGMGNGTTTPGATITNNTVSNFATFGMYLTATFATTVSGNTMYGNTTGMQITGTKDIISNNNIFSNSSYGINLNGTLYSTINGNTIYLNGNGGIYLNGNASDNVVSSNNIYNNGGAGNDEGIIINGSNDNLIASNHIIDGSCTTACNAIDIQGSTSNRTTLTNNTFNTVTTETINDLGTGTIYSGQSDGSGNYIITPLSGGSIKLQAATSISSTLTVSGTLTVTNGGNVAFQKGTDFSTTGSSNDVNFGTGALFRLTGVSAQTITGIAGGADGRVITLVNAGTNAATLANLSGSSLAANQISTGTGASISVAAGGSIGLVYDSGASLWRVVGAAATTGSGTSYVTLQGSTPGTADTGNFNISGTGIAANLQGTTSVKTALLDTVSAGTLNIGTTTATAISIGGSAVTSTFSGTLVVGNGGNTMTLSSTGVILAGNARNAKVYRLPAEYAGAVLDTGATGNNTGTMTSGYDQTNRMNYYKWTTTQVTNQTYDVVIQVPIPKDFDSWNTNPVQLTVYTSDTTNGTVTVQVLKSSGSADSNFSTFQSATPGSTSTWTTKNFTTLDGSGYTAGDYLTIRIRMQSPTSGDVRIGNLVLNYLTNK